MHRARPIPLLLFVALGGCVASIDAPSLAPRAAERQPIDAPAAAGEVATPADPALVQRIGPLVAAAEEGHRLFEDERRTTETLIARAAGTSPGGEAWTAAQAALSALDTARAGVRDAASAIDDIRLEPANAAPGNRAAIEAAAARIDALATAEATAMARIGARLS